MWFCLKTNCSTFFVLIVSLAALVSTENSDEDVVVDVQGPVLDYEWQPINEKIDRIDHDPNDPSQDPSLEPRHGVVVKRRRRLHKRPSQNQQNFLNQQPIDGFMDEENQELPAYKRRRVNPKFEDDETTNQEPSKPYRKPYDTDNNEERPTKHYRKPYGQHKSEDGAPKTDLKSLLKQSGGQLSLSEILQQRNLSLSDLLKRKEEAVQLITSAEPIQITSPMPKDYDDEDDNQVGLDDQAETNTHRFKPKKPKENKENDISKDEPKDDPRDHDQIDQEDFRDHEPKIYHKDEPNDSKTYSPIDRSAWVNDKEFPSNHYDHGNTKSKTRLPLAKKITVETQTEASSQKVASRISGGGRLPSVKKNKEDEDKSVNSPSDKITNGRQHLSGLIKRRYPENVKHFEVVTEATTEKRIFVPTIPRRYDDDDKNQEITTFKATTTSEMPQERPPMKNNHFPLIIKENGLGIKRNKLAMKPRIPFNISQNIINSKPDLKKDDNEINKNSKNEQSELRLPQGAIKINVKDLLTKRVIDDGPMRISMNIESNDEKMSTSQREETETKPSTRLTESQTTTKPKPLSAKDEIMEVLKSASGRARLASILSKRNMTMNELVALRERGASQNHLADIFHNQTREPVATDTVVSVVESQESRKSVDKKPVHSVHNRPVKLALTDEAPQKELELRLNELKTEYAKSLEVNSPKIPEESDPFLGAINRAVDSPDVFDKFDTYRNSRNLNHGMVGRGESIPLTYVPQKYQPPKPYQSLDNPFSDFNDQIFDYESNLSKIQDEIISSSEEDEAEMMLQNYNLNNEEYLQLPSKTKSTIFASLGIVFGSIIVFLSILLACKYWQHRRTRIYSSSFSARVSKYPILETDPRVNTLARSGHFKNNIVIGNSGLSNGGSSSFSSEFDERQNIQRNIWHAIRKPFY